MQLIPAIDLRGGHCVRLLYGDFGRETRYDVDPVELASSYRELGAAWLHVVDLDGAASGEPRHLSQIDTIKRTAGLKVQLGGGIRSHETLLAALEFADRVVLGSLAVSAPRQVEAWLAEVGPDRLTLGFDVRFKGGTPHLTTHGWTRDSTLTLSDAVEQYRAYGLRHVLCTDVGRDGALSGPNLTLYRDAAERWPDVEFQASGGIRDARDLAELSATGVTHAISGKALLEGRITAEEMRPFLRNA